MLAPPVDVGLPNHLSQSIPFMTDVTPPLARLLPANAQHLGDSHPQIRELQRLQRQELELQRQLQVVTT